MDRTLGENSLRIRATHFAAMNMDDWALLPQKASNVKISFEGTSATIVNGKIRAEVTGRGKITFYNHKERSAS